MTIRANVMYGNHPQWTFIQSDSKDLGAIALQLLKQRPFREAFTFDVLLIDGDHSYDGCYADLHNYAHMAKRVFVHDTEHDTEVEVSPAVKDYLATVNREVIWHHGTEIGEPFKLCEECRCNRAEPGQRICYSCRSSC